MDGLRRNSNQRRSVHRTILGRHLQTNCYQRSRFKRIGLCCCNGESGDGESSDGDVSLVEPGDGGGRQFVDRDGDVERGGAGGRCAGNADEQQCGGAGGGERDGDGRGEDSHVSGDDEYGSDDDVVVDLSDL